MIDKFYIDFKVRDYMDNDSLKEINSDNIIDCSLGTNDFIDVNIIKKHILKSNYELNKYPISEYELLQDEIIRYWKNHVNFNLKRKNISFGPGVMGILRNLSEFLINNTSKVLGCTPQFPRFISEVELKRATYEYYSMEKENNYKFIVEDFLKKIDKDFDVIHIENPNNPTGQIIDINDVEKIIIEAKKHNSIVLVDEAYGDYMDSKNSAITLIEKYDNIVVLRSASKYYGLPNHRVGYLVANDSIIEVYNEITIPFPFSDLSANVFRNILKDYKKFEYIKEDVKDINRKMYKALKNDNYLFTNIETPIFTVKSKKYENLSSELRKYGIIAENCDNFLNLDSSYARLRISKEWKTVLKILKDIL